MLLVRDGLGGFGSFGAGYVPKPSGDGVPYVPAPSNATTTPYVPKPAPSDPRFTAQALDAQYREFLNQWSEAQRIEEWGLAAKLPACPPTSMTGATQCYTGAAPNLLPPGTFIAYGVPFNVGEFRKGETLAFTKTVRANVIQREVIEHFVRKRSAQLFGKQLGYVLFGLGPTQAVNFQLDRLSIKQAMTLVPGFVVYLRGIKYNPITPTADEYDDVGGLARWFARGGFPLITGVADGTIAQDEAYSPIICQSILCRCPSVVDPTRKPVSCVRAYITKDGGMSQHPGTSLATFWVYFKLDANGDITISLDYDEPSKLEQFGNAMAGVFEALGKMLCMAAPAAKEQMAAMTLTKCVDKAGKVCKQGATGCTCVTPPDSTAVAVGTTNAVMTKWCEGWNKEYAPQQDFPIDNIMPPVENKTPWAWIIGGLALAGGLMYAAKR